MYRLFHEFAHRYDLHTPPGHYKHDHAFVMSEALRVAPTNCRLLDIGCGTGVFLESAIAAGIDGYGIDAAPEMVNIAKRWLGEGRVRLQRMQENSERNAYHIVCSLSWTIHYCESQEQFHDVLRRCRDALRPNGLLILQVANDQKMTGAVNIEHEPGPLGETDDTMFIHRFKPLQDPQHLVVADYVYASRAYKELLYERHELRFANPSMIVQILREIGFNVVNIANSKSIAPFVIGRIQ
jgi:SAM-dependent methyltransferase